MQVGLFDCCLIGSIAIVAIIAVIALINYLRQKSELKSVIKKINSVILLLVYTVLTAVTFTFSTTLIGITICSVLNIRIDGLSNINPSGWATVILCIFFSLFFCYLSGSLAKDSWLNIRNKTSKRITKMNS